MSQENLISVFTDLVKNYFKSYFDYTDVQTDYIQLANGKLDSLHFYIYVELLCEQDKCVCTQLVLTEQEAKNFVNDFYYNEDTSSMYELVIKAYQEMIKTLVLHI